MRCAGWSCVKLKEAGQWKTVKEVPLLTHLFCGCIVLSWCSFRWNITVYFSADRCTLSWNVSSQWPAMTVVSQTTRVKIDANTQGRGLQLEQCVRKRLKPGRKWTFHCSPINQYMWTLTSELNLFCYQACHVIYLHLKLISPVGINCSAMAVSVDGANAPLRWFSNC